MSHLIMQAVIHSANYGGDSSRSVAENADTLQQEAKYFAALSTKRFRKRYRHLAVDLLQQAMQTFCCKQCRHFAAVQTFCCNQCRHFTASSANICCKQFRHFAASSADILPQAVQTFYCKQCKHFAASSADILLQAVQTFYCKHFRHFAASSADILEHAVQIICIKCRHCALGKTLCSNCRLVSADTLQHDMQTRDQSEVQTFCSKKLKQCAT